MFLDNISHTAHTQKHVSFTCQLVCQSLILVNGNTVLKTALGVTLELGFKESGKYRQEREIGIHFNRDSFLHVFRQVKQKEFHLFFLQLWL